MSARDDHGSTAGTRAGYSGGAGGLGNGGVGGGQSSGSMGGGSGRNGGSESRTGLRTDATMYGKTAYGRSGDQWGPGLNGDPRQKAY